ncbi:MAG: response regulator [Gemmatimonas sp.]
MPRVLIIDDEPSIRFALRRWFERQGWVVDEANDGASALEILLAPAADGSAGYAVIVCDLRMPGMSGSQLHARLKTERPALIERLVFTTGDDVASPPVGAFVGSQKRLLQKPFEFTELRELVESIVGPM